MDIYQHGNLEKYQLNVLRNNQLVNQFHKMVKLINKLHFLQVLLRKYSSKSSTSSSRLNNFGSLSNSNPVNFSYNDLAILCEEPVNVV